MEKSFTSSALRRLLESEGFLVTAETGILSQWQLAYPTTFFVGLAERALANLRKHLEAKDLDPYTFYEFGSTWKRVVLNHR